jgi:hypothetical protein
MDDLSDINWNEANYRQMYAPPPRQEAAVDIEVSRIVGQTVRVNDPRLIRFVATWKHEHPNDPNSQRMDSYMRDDAFRKALTKAFNG